MERDPLPVTASKIVDAGVPVVIANGNHWKAITSENEANICVTDLPEKNHGNCHRRCSTLGELFHADGTC